MSWNRRMKWKLEEELRAEEVRSDCKRPEKYVRRYEEDDKVKRLCICR